MFNYKKYKIREVVIFLISILFALSLVELTARFVYKYQLKDEKLVKSKVELLSKYPQVYSDKSIYTPEVLKRDFSFPLAEYDNVKRVWRVKDFKSKYFNINNGSRVTEFANQDPKNFIFMFGGSTLFCDEVPDKYTVSSYLQLFVNKISDKYNVINHGILLDMTHTQVIRLKETPLKEGDIVIFYGGSNDVAFILERDNRSGIQEDWAKGHLAKNNIQYYSPIERAIIKAYYAFPKSYIFKILHKNITIEKLDDSGIHKESISSNIEYLPKYYLNQIRTAKNFIDEKNAYFFNFVQPNMYTKNIKNLTTIEKEIKKNEELTKHSFEKYFSLGYPIIQNLIKKNEINEYSYDLTNIFDNTTQEIFAGDFVHTNHIGNEIIAKSIFNIIKERINKNL